MPQEHMQFIAQLIIFLKYVLYSGKFDKLFAKGIHRNVKYQSFRSCCSSYEQYQVFFARSHKDQKQYGIFANRDKNLFLIWNNKTDQACKI